jgi:NADH-quinone oxidoreductase subunit F
MPQVNRVLDAQPVATHADHVDRGGGRGLEAAVKLGPAGTLDELEAAGLRGRGGAGFPTATKWRTVDENRVTGGPLTVVVNAAEGEPGTFKDRSLIRANPFKVLEGALIAARTLLADRVVIAMKSSFERERALMDSAIAAATGEGWCEGLDVSVFAGPEEYLFGEETGLLEALEGRPPFPRITPPYRRGAEATGPEATPGAGDKPLAGPGAAPAAPTLVNNAETFAHVASILAEGATWFRAEGTDSAPGTVVCTVTGNTKTHGMGEFPMGTPLAEVIETLGGIASPGGNFVAVSSGVSGPLLPASLLATPVGYEEFEAAGATLGSAGFIVFDDSVDIVAAVAGISRFLSVESCGQCTPCKRDGLVLAGLLERFARSDPGAQPADNLVAELTDRAATVSEEARCFLAHQHEAVVGSLLSLFPDHVARRAAAELPAVEPLTILPLSDIENGKALYAEQQAAKQPDWTFDAADSGTWPAERLDSAAGEA